MPWYCKKWAWALGPVGTAHDNDDGTSHDHDGAAHDHQH
jgi:hypothetical protein